MSESASIRVVPHIMNGMHLPRTEMLPLKGSVFAANPFGHAQERSGSSLGSRPSTGHPPHNFYDVILGPFERFWAPLGAQLAPNGDPRVPKRSLK